MRGRQCACGHTKRIHRGFAHDQACSAENLPTYTWSDENGSIWQYIVVKCECTAYQRRTGE